MTTRWSNGFKDYKVRYKWLNSPGPSVSFCFNILIRCFKHNVFFLTRVPWFLKPKAQRQMYEMKSVQFCYIYFYPYLFLSCAHEISVNKEVDSKVLHFWNVLTENQYNMTIGIDLIYLHSYGWKLVYISTFGFFNRQYSFIRNLFIFCLRFIFY